MTSPASTAIAACSALAGLFAMAIATGAVHAIDVDAVRLPDRVRLEPAGAELVLNGAGPRTRAYVRVYVAGLYLGAKRSDARQVLADKGPKRLSMTMLRDLSAQQLTDALIEGVRENHTPSELETLKVPLDELVVLIARIGVLRTGAVVTLDYLPGSGTRVTVNGAARGRPVGGDDLYPALLRIWLGDDPVDRGLRRALLGS